MTVIPIISDKPLDILLETEGNAYVLWGDDKEARLMGFGVPKGAAAITFRTMLRDIVLVEKMKFGEYIGVRLNDKVRVYRYDGIELTLRDTLFCKFTELARLSHCKGATPKQIKIRT